MFFSSLLFCPLLAFTTPFYEGEAVIDYLKFNFETNYAPHLLKKEVCGWNLDEESEKLRAALRSRDVKIWRKALKGFFDATQDAHVQIHFQSSAISYLPFEIREAEGRYFVVFVDHEVLSEEVMQAGDELLFWNGEPIDTVVQRYIKDEFDRCSTDRSWFELALLYFTLRDGEMGLQQENGEILVHLLRDGEIKSQVVSWISFPELFPDHLAPKRAQMRSDANRFEKIGTPLQQLLSVDVTLPIWDTNFEETAKREKKMHPFRLGNKLSFLPLLGPVVWRAGEREPYDAYIFEAKNGEKMGYIRIPHFRSNRTTDFFALGRAVKKIKDAGATLLVLDLMHNPGGLMLNMYAVASLFIDQPIDALSQAEVLTNEQIKLALTVKGELASYKGIELDLQGKKSYYGYPVDHLFRESIKNYADFVLEEASYKKQVTENYPYLGIKKIYPHPRIQYTGPILMLVDSLDFSCAELFEVLLKDAGRARLFGAKTVGAGGGLSPPIIFPNRLGIGDFLLTTSIVTRPNGGIIEGKGVEPDVYCLPTAEDFLHHFEPYKEKILEEIERMRSSGVEPETFGSGGQRSIH